MTQVFRAPKLFDGMHFDENRDVLVERGRVVGTRPAGSGPAVEMPPGCTLAPGFVDLQVNGGDGVMLNDAPSVERIARIARAHARTGSTTIMPTLISAPRPLVAETLAVARQALEAGMPGVAGLHLEGPFLAPSRKGVHPEANLTVPTEADIDALVAPFPGKLLVTLAPERVPAGMIERLARAGVIVFAGHTDATLEQMAAALEAGVTGFTHLYNAMSPLTVREPGAVGAVFDHKTARAGIIADALHVHPAAVRVALRCLGPSRLFFVSDAMATAASEKVSFELYGQTITLTDGRLTNEGGTLAGAHLTMAEAVQIAVRDMGIAPGDALRMASLTPAKALGRNDLGRIARGNRADFVAVDREMRVAAVWQGGERIR